MEPAREHIAFLADGHITSDDPARIETLCRSLERLGESCATVCVLGDLFEVWLGVARAEPHVERVGGALRALRARGVRTIYVEGNRDFAIGRGSTQALFDRVVQGEITERFGERSFHLSHGDLVNTEDRPYRAWRALSKRVIAPVLLRTLSSRAAIGLAHRLERRLRTTNRRHKSRFPEQRCLEFARARVASGADVVVVGHFHHEFDAPVAAGGRQGRFLSLPFWHEEPRPVLFDGSGQRRG